jgi:hypothetical protein
MREEYIPRITFKTHEGYHDLFFMPFGLTNATSTFHILMNSTFKPFLKNIVLVFFDDILSYNKDWEENVQNDDMVLKLLEEKEIYVKPSKYVFGVYEVEYFGHIISHWGINVRPNKITTMMQWIITKTLKILRGFFIGLEKDYYKFFKNYGGMEDPLTKLLNNDGFSWTWEATRAFQRPNMAMCSAIVLDKIEFLKLFILECDALVHGIGAILM